jgi:hypothetical protein
VELEELGAARGDRQAADGDVGIALAARRFGADAGRLRKISATERGAVFWISSNPSELTETELSSRFWPRATPVTTISEASDSSAVGQRTVGRGGAGGTDWSWAKAGTATRHAQDSKSWIRPFIIISLVAPVRPALGKSYHPPQTIASTICNRLRHRLARSLHGSAGCRHLGDDDARPHADQAAPLARGHHPDEPRVPGLQFSFGLQQSNMGPIYSYLGADEATMPLLWLAGPMTGLLIQPIIGAMSDRTVTRFGRRTPYFLVGAVLCSLCLFAMPYSRTLWMAASLLWVLDAANNVTMEPYRAYISDRLDERQRPARLPDAERVHRLAQTLSYLAPRCWSGGGWTAMRSTRTAFR